MNLTSSTVVKISDEHAVQFFRELKVKLNFSSSRKTVALVRMVLARLRASYTLQQMKEILAKTPSTFHLLLISQCRYEEKRKSATWMNSSIHCIGKTKKPVRGCLNLKLTH
jgi:hypothetical protein